MHSKYRLRVHTHGVGVGLLFVPADPHLDRQRAAQLGRHTLERTPIGHHVANTRRKPKQGGGGAL